MPFFIKFKEIIFFLGSFGIITVASHQLSKASTYFRLPRITGLLATGILVGPYILNLLTKEGLQNLNLVNDFSLAFIAFAAGAELFLKDYQERLKSISWVTSCLVIATFSITSTTVYFLADWIPFLASMPGEGRLAISMLTGVIFVARSPSSAIAIIKELRAKGPFTQISLGVTVIQDIAVIILWTICFSISLALLSEESISTQVIFLLSLELFAGISLGFLLGKIMQLFLSTTFPRTIKSFILLFLGYITFVSSHFISYYSLKHFAHKIHIEPLLVCMIASFYVTNFSLYRLEWNKIIQENGKYFFAAFFTLTGASLGLAQLLKVWPLAILLVLVRIIALMIGCFFGGLFAGEQLKTCKMAWMSFVTQAGISLGLVVEATHEFPDWGPDFGTLIIGIIVVNQVIGPPLFKWALMAMEESHQRGLAGDFEGINNAIIFGLEGQSIALARQLEGHGWEVKIATKTIGIQMKDNSEVDIHMVHEYDLQALEELEAKHYEALVLMLSDEENYELCTLAFEHYGTKEIVVRINKWENFERFHELGALIVEPHTAIVSLLDHMVRSPTSTSLMLGQEKDQDMIDIEMRDPNFDGVALRELHLPLDTLILSIKRKGEFIISHGFTRLQLGDELTVVGSTKSLLEVEVIFNKE
ncbi:monovalent cation:proton antiporter family protein [Candidatus Riflebacteria bacterium]